MAVKEMYDYLQINDIQFINDYKRRGKIYCNSLKRPTRQHQLFNTKRLIDKTNELMKQYGRNTFCVVSFKYVRTEFVPYDISILPYSKNVHVKVLLSQAYNIFDLLNTNKIIPLRTGCYESVPDVYEL